MPDGERAADFQRAAGGGDTPARAADWPALFVFALLVFTVALQFFTRYVLNDSLGWTEEIARYLLILLGFSGAVVCARNHSHIALEFFYRYLPAAAVKMLDIVCRLMTAAFFLYCGWLAIELARRTAGNMASVPLPKSVIYYIVAAACAAAGIVAAAAVVKRARDKKSAAD